MWFVNFKHPNQICRSSGTTILSPRIDGMFFPKFKGLEGVKLVCVSEMRQVA